MDRSFSARITMVPRSGEYSPLVDGCLSMSARVREYVSLVAGIAVLLCARATLADHYVVPSGSMLPTVHVGDRIAVDKTAYGLRIPVVGSYAIRGDGPQRGDIVVLESPEDGRTLLKRVLGLPGEVIEVKGDEVFVNGEKLPVKITKAGWIELVGGTTHGLATFGLGPDWGPSVLPEEGFLVLGDNRGNSHDGRAFGVVDRDRILGRARVVFWRDSRPEWAALD